MPSLPRVLGAGALVVLQLFGNGCASPAKRMDATAEALGFTRSVVTTPAFAHRLYARLNEQPPPTLHVYLDGDGSPWLGRYVVSADPTPRNPMVLQLMAADPSPSVYLGRPCYHGLRDYTQVLKELAPGDTVEIVFRRDDGEHRVAARVVER